MGSVKMTPEERLRTLNQGQDISSLVENVDEVVELLCQITGKNYFRNTRLIDCVTNGDSTNATPSWADCHIVSGEYWATLVDNQKDLTE